MLTRHVISLFPGINLLLSCWYSRREQNLRVAIFFAGATLAGAFGGALAYGISKMDGIGGLEGWRWIFLLEGVRRSPDRRLCSDRPIAYYHPLRSIILQVPR